MNFLSRLEEACATFVERVFAQTFKGEVQPAEVARKIAAALESYALGEHGAAIPRALVVRVSTGEYERLRPFRGEISERWRELVDEASGSLGIALPQLPAVRLVADESMPPGSVAVKLEVELVTSTLALVVQHGLPERGRVLFQHGAIIGRDAACDLVLRDPRVSRHHARIECGSGGCEIVDLGSRNGTLVDGRRVERAPLTPGTRVELGDTLLAVEEIRSGP